LTSEEKERIVNALEKKTGHRVELLCTVDEKILGGIIINTEETVMDGSLRRKIHDVKEVIKVESKT
jgi:F-type H+-transporting ATPase subunit delta